ncbi:MAG TPA: serine hydrolase domain-containing protein [Mycobacteriales bacterium]|nr:serine hydrolase domain-containing protein [Mycobacteriales bacterium]
MGQLQVEVEPGEVGMDAGRLSRVDSHLARYVDEGELPGWLVLVSRGGKVAHLSTYGHRHVEDGLPVEVDTRFRIYSMTKPITSVAAMMLYEEGAFELTDPVSRFIPAFADMRVWSGGTDLRPATVPATEPMRIWHLLTHTAGLTYGFHRSHAVDARYRAAGYEFGSPPGADLARVCDDWAAQPLLFEPGAEWNYSVATDVLGRVVEVASGRTLEEFFAERILGPLGMDETTFGVSEEEAGRLARLYLARPEGGIVPFDRFGAAAIGRPDFLSGGAGLVSTAGDYHRFTQMLLRGGELDGVRLLGPRTVAYMTRNHLPGGADLEAYGRPLYAETTFAGVGFGLGFSVVQDPATYRVLTSAGEYGWGGLASTAFWIDPAEDLTVLFMTQLLPSSTLPVRTYLRQLVQQAVVGDSR